MATQFERAAQRGLLKCVERLGKFVEVEDEDNTVNEVYEKETDTTTYLMDVIRFLRKDNEELKPLRQLLCQWEIVQRHLLPLLTHYRNDRDLVMQIVRCMILLTGPVDPNARQADRQLLYLQQAKEAFLDQDALAVLMEVLVTILAKPERDVKTDQAMMEGILVLFKNLLAVPDPKPSTSSGDAHKHRLQDNFIIALFEENVLEFYMHLLQNINRSENKKFLHLMLETVYLLFHRDSPADLVTAYHDAQTSQNKEVSATLKTQVQRERKYSELLTNVTHGARHQRFGGCFVTTSTDGSKSIKNKSVQRILPRDVLPKPLNNPRGRKRLASDVTPQSSSRVQVILKRVGEQIIEYCYNDFVSALARDRFEAAKTLAASEDQYYWFIGYFVGLNHHIQLAKKSQDSTASSFDVTSVSVSVTFDTLREMVDKCQAWFELKQWPRLQLVMRAFKELITNIVSMYTSADAELKRAARILTEKLFYHRELCLDRLVQFIRGFNPSKQTKTYLVDLIQVIHAVLKLLELETSGSRKLITRKKRSGRSTHANKSEKEEFVQDKQYAAEGETAQPIEGEAALVDGAADDALSVSDDEDGHISDDTYLTVPQYLSLYAKASVLRPYLLALKDYTHNSETVNHMIIKMFYRLADKPLHYRGLFYQITVLRVFNQILNDPMIEHDARFKEMRSFAAHIVRHFITDLQKKPEVKGIEVLFWRHKGECLSNSSTGREDDDGPDQPEEDVDFDIDAELKQAAENKAAEEHKKRRVTKKIVRKVTRVSNHVPETRDWSDDEIEELRNLFARYSGPDCLDVIVNLMTGVTACQCHHKLHELGLIDETQRCPAASEEEEQEEEVEVEVSEEEVPVVEQVELERESATRSGRSIFRGQLEDTKHKKSHKKRNKDKKSRSEREESEAETTELDATEVANTTSAEEVTDDKKTKHKKHKRDKKSKKHRSHSKKHKSGNKKRKREQSDEELPSDQLERDLALDDEERPTKRRRLMPMSQDE